MTEFFLAAHVLAAIIAVGPVTVAASMFPAAVRRARSAGPDAASMSAVRVLHRICRVYAAVGLAVPVFGFATAAAMDILTDTWLVVSVLLTAAAAAVLAFAVLPRQDALLAALDRADSSGGGGGTARLAAFTGVFNLLWAVVTVLMIVRPGSTAGG